MLINNKMLKKAFILYCVCISLLLGVGCTNKDNRIIQLKGNSEPTTKNEFVLGTIVTITLYEEETEKIFARISERLKDIENKMSLKIEGSEVNLINKAAGKSYVEVSQDVYKVVETGIAYSKNSNGRFDISIGPLVQLWDIGGVNQNRPTDEDIQIKKAFINYEDIYINKEEKSIMLAKEGMILDLGGIGKGYAADEIVIILKEEGVQRAILNLGGNVLVLGTKPDGSDFKVGIQDPLSDRGAYMGVLSLKDKTVVSSGVYERYFELDGKRYHHILDPATGYPVDNDLLAVTIVTDKSMDADALSTSLFALGKDAGMAYIDSLDNVEALIVTRDKEVIVSNGLKDKFKLTNKDYEVQ